ncbi:restriction endonuclease subunit S, partial [Ruminococcaceae bacterium OttesenSCG-928-I18]|nr:restriction endonuclease subunit S [Ruminococcaceae bacterium OttesenSCG-928-I18]
MGKWEMVRLGDVCLLKAGKFIPAADITDFYTDGLYSCYGGNGLRGYVNKYTHNGTYPLIGRQGALCGNVQYATGLAPERCTR